MLPDSTIEGDVELKRWNTLKAIEETIKRHNGCTLMVLEEVPYLFKAFVEAGVRMFETHGGSIYLGKDQLIKPGSPLQVRVENLRTVRSLVGDDAYVTIPGYGTFTSPVAPIPFTDDEALALSAAGASGCHTHKWKWKDLENLVKIAHRNGLIVDAYISHPKDKYYYYGIPAETPEDVSKVAKRMQETGVDLIGILTGMTYQGLNAGSMSSEIKQRIDALMSAADVPTIVEGGITLDNFRDFRKCGVDVLVIYTAFVDMLVETARSTAKQIVEWKGD
jgi:hypothetical protein